MDDLAQGLKLLFIAAIVIMVGLGALTIVWAVIGLVWGGGGRVVPIVLFCAVALWAGCGSLAA